MKRLTKENVRELVSFPIVANILVGYSVEIDYIVVKMKEYTDLILYFEDTDGEFISELRENLNNAMLSGILHDADSVDNVTDIIIIRQYKRNKKSED